MAERGNAVPARRLAVLGSPIAHSRSPRLHAAAYEVLGLPWSYEAIEVDEAGLGPFLDSLTPEWRGLSLTMPLKREAVRLAGRVDRIAALTDAANTMLLGASSGEPRSREVFNTDVAGIVGALGDVGLVEARHVEILGGGATAASALTAAAELGAEHVSISARNPAKLGPLEDLGRQLGLAVAVGALGERAETEAELVVSTLPGDATDAGQLRAADPARSVLLDVAYDPWPSARAQQWERRGGTVVSGLGMLVHQALVQVRIFVEGDPLVPLDREEPVLAALRAAAGIDERGAHLA
ncbi:shikimate dehydrogenase [Compostimonas suwonensis]|uniref:Shikimate dehydrogenase n=1 Tax=Compostimonas suwonensis TaxID=1048394 RepID=A0A2M9BYH1_9MICO|nr:shikimate dehydrogenase [Compostimonas suwonensis]PJJ63125.1 shikimate dehydrogenase [Compostimonas suwonensis]